MLTKYEHTNDVNDLRWSGQLQMTSRCTTLFAVIRVKSRSNEAVAYELPSILQNIAEPLEISQASPVDQSA